MSTNNWETISDRLEHALALPMAERNVYLAEVSRTDGADISREVAALLQADQDSEDFLQTNALRLTAKHIANHEAPICADETFGNYRIVKKLGAGGMGEVFLAIDETLQRRVALKFLPQFFMQDDEQRARFADEARAASALNHPNILTVYEIGSANGRAFIATEYVEGVTLRERIATCDLTVPEILSITEQIAEALSAAHAAGIIHRDIKPENMMVRPDGYVKVLDFGLAAELRIADCGLRIEESLLLESALPASSNSAIRNPQSAIGTPRYMSPEQVRGEALDGRTDLWSLGATLYEMLTARALWTGNSTEQILSAIKDDKPAPLQLSAEHPHLQAILQKALAKDSAQRYANAQDLRADLKRAARPRQISRRWFVAAALLFVAILTAMMWRMNSTSPPQTLYWELSETAKTQFVTSAAQTITARLGDRPASLTPEHVTRIRAHVERYIDKRDSLATTPGQESIKTVYARASVYAPFIIEEFRAHNLPPILGLYIAMNETEYHPCTESAVGAKGLFSFMPRTAENYGLRLKPQDERCDPRKIANAAARYLDDLTKIFGRDADGVTLAMIAYNCGEHCVARAIADAERRSVPRVNIWTLLEYNADSQSPLSKETQNYAPRFLAAAILGEHPDRFGLEIQPLSQYASNSRDDK
jgi:serine/threonine protein kinase